MNHRVLTTGYVRDEYVQQFRYCYEVAGEWEKDWWTQVINDVWEGEAEQHCWYFRDENVALLFKVFSGGILLKVIK